MSCFALELVFDEFVELEVDLRGNPVECVGQTYLWVSRGQRNQATKFIKLD